MNDFTREQYAYERSRGRGRVIVCAVLTLVLAAAVFAGCFLILSDRAERDPVRTAEETIITNISANMINAIDPAVIEAYRASHHTAANQSRYCYEPSDGFLTPSCVNTDITADCVGAVTSLTIDMKENNDLTALPYFSNLNVLRIAHAEFLTDADIAEMNRVNLSEVEFIIDRNDITNRQKFADFSLCTAPNKHITLNNADFINENTAYAIYHLFGRYYPSVVCTGLNYDFYKQIDDRLQTLIEQVHFDNCVTDKDRLLKCLVVVMKHLYYDDEVSDFSMNNNALYESSSIYDLVTWYNDCQLSSNLLNGKEIGYGCCTNFTSLLLAVCVKLDYEAYMVDGKRSADTGFLHDWLYAPADGTYYCIDMTETNRWFKRSAGMFHGYNGTFIEGDKDIMDDPDFYARFQKQIFETYNNEIFRDYVFFDDLNTLVPQIDTTRNTVTYNFAASPVVKYIPDYEPGRREARTKSAAAGAAVLLIGLVVTAIVAKKRRAY
ncbi:MAG: hypothetical protein IJK89_00040 [Clostridia bacterium]|nr:hypothetical protein [Clostridia bacterium]